MKLPKNSLIAYGKLTGPNGKSLSVCTIWMTETETKSTKFITMYPDKGDIRK